MTQDISVITEHWSPTFPVETYFKNNSAVT